VKGIEKEGKAEFKVFGKEHTLSMDKPSATPTKDLPPAKSNDPPKTSDKPASCSAKPKVKRANEIKYVDDPPMQILVRTAAKPKADWRDGDGWAIQQAWAPSSSFSVIPEHYLLIVGLVSITITNEDVKDCNGKVERQIDVWNRKYNSRAYDIAPSNDPTLDGACVLLPRGMTDANIPYNWFAKAGASYTNKGPIRSLYTIPGTGPGSGQDNILKVANARTQNMGKYAWTTNNCRDFTVDLYKQLS
jgi:hypothetical protein